MDTDTADKLDFFLIRFLLTLSETRSMQQAAHMLGLSQSGASRKLSRANEIFGTELFIRSGTAMLPSARMEELTPLFDSILEQQKALFNPKAAFDPAKLDRTFTVTTMDHGLLAIFSPAIGPILKEAPGLRIEVMELKNATWQALRTGEVDFTAYPSDRIPPDFDSLLLYRTQYVVMVRRGHPLEKVAAKKGRVDAEDILPYSRIGISVNRHTLNSDYELSPVESLADQHTALKLPYFLAAPMLLADTDCTLQLPLVSARFWSRVLPLTILPTSHLRTQSFEPRLVWHRRKSGDAAHQWVRSMIALHVRNFVAGL